MRAVSLNSPISVLDEHGFVELQDIMGDDNAIVTAARTSFLGETRGMEADKKLLFYLMKHEHMGPFEMVEFRFRIKAPVVVWWQLVRHRTANINLQSGRYLEYDENEYYIPEPGQWRMQSQSNKQGSDGMYDPDGGAELTLLMLDHWDNSYKLYESALRKGIAREQARLFLPAWAIHYTGVWKIDARNLMGMLRLRTAPDAQYEIRTYAQAIFDHFFKPALPWTSEAYDQFVKGQSK